MARVKGTVRRSQLITTYGVGALVAVNEESFMVCGLDRWHAEKKLEIHEPRLERLLGVERFLLPPAGEHSEDVPVIRFPTWYSCPSCKRVAQFGFFSVGGRARCSACECDLVPSRFVVCCENGHIDDFPYFKWIHAGAPGRDERSHSMCISAVGKTASLRDVVLTCSCGVSPVSLEGAFDRSAMQRLGVRCSGRRPWLEDAVRDCDCVPRVLQRGASNVWYSAVRSSLSIPPWSEGVQAIIARNWENLRRVPDNQLELVIEACRLAEGTPYTTNELVDAARERKSGTSVDVADIDSLKRQEYDALCRGRPEGQRAAEFVCEQVPLAPRLSGWIAQVMAVKRLREVRALESFARVTPWVPGDRQERRAPLASSCLDWLPAIEVSGEGIFVRIREDVLEDWEGGVRVVARAEMIKRRYVNSYGENGFEEQITARMLLVHSAAHALINQMSLECGYPVASLRERLYVSPKMAGLMIYTATSDSAGSLGGIVSACETGRFADVVEGAMRAAEWCSSDPLCMETEGAGVCGLNLAACHACLLLPETCCEMMNSLLDRWVLVDPQCGFVATTGRGGS